MLNTSLKKDYGKSESVYLSSPLTQVTQDSPSLYPPGRILHIVRKYPHESLNERCKSDKSEKTIFQIIEADNRNFNELLISPRMLQDHMPQSVLKAMKAVS
jgi:hypothetical protein